MTDRIEFSIGGAVQAKQGTYLPRPADELLLKACQESQFASVLACRFIGKSSLMFETSRKLAELNIRTAVIDLNSIGRSLEANIWYFNLVDEIAHKLELAVDVSAWWEERPRLSTPTQRFLQFFREVVLKEIPDPIVIFVDEIDMILGLDFTDDFFTAIRSVYTDRVEVPAYQRLSFVLLGVATPDELISDPTRTPFNIGQTIPLHDFTKEECEPFRLEIEAKYPDQGRSYFDQIYDWTAGHPFLTQKLSDAVLNGVVSEPEREKGGRIEYWVNHLFLAADARGEENLQFVQNRITSDPHRQEMLKIYKRILENKKPVLDDAQSPAISRLKLYGLVLADNGQLKVRNRLYKRVFDLAWTHEMLRLSSASTRLGLPSHYKILQEIGQGGFSTVYLAQREEEDKTQSVALKVLNSVNDDNQVRRFKQEAQALIRLEHPNIIPIFEIHDDEESFFIAMEYISGGTVRDRLEEGPLPRSEAIHIVKQIGKALTLAHERGIIHRDIKPGNILLDTSQEPVRPVLTDFGLIKLSVGDDDFSKTQSKAVLGTPIYMAPEQWRWKTPTPATDVYALGLTFFEMLAGQRPFEAGSLFDLMNNQADDPLPLLSHLVPEIGPYFDDILLKATAKEPAERYQTVASFIEALEAANAQAERLESTWSGQWTTGLFYRLEANFSRQKMKITDPLFLTLKLIPAEKPTIAAASYFEVNEPTDVMNVRLISNDFALAPGEQDIVALPVSPRLIEADKVQNRIKLQAKHAGGCRLRLQVLYNNRQQTLDLPAVLVKAVEDAPAPQLPDPFPPRPVRQPDLVLRVVTGPTSQSDSDYKLTYFLYARDRRLHLSGMPVGEKILRSETLDQIGTHLNQILREGANLTAQAVSSRLMAFGRYLYDLLFPETLQEIYREDIANQANITSWLILTDPTPWLPWELVRPYAATIKEAFMGERFYLGRWLEGMGQPRHCEIPIGPIHLALDAHLSEASREAWVQLFPPGTLLPGHLLRREKTPYHLDLSTNPDVWGIHFVGYPATFVQDGRELMAVDHQEALSTELVDGYWPDLRRKRPLVGFSLIYPGQVSALTEIDRTWIPTFIRAGAGAFIGPYWATSPQADRLFWSEFYNGVWAGMALGEALLYARQQLRAIMPDSIDWLAYTLVGDPLAQGYQPQAGDGYASLECIGHDLNQPMQIKQRYHFRANLQTAPPLWYNGELYRIERQNYQEPQLTLVAPEFEVDPPLPQKLMTTTSDTYALEFDLIPKRTGEHRLSALFLEAGRPLQSVTLNLTVREKGRS